MGLFNRMFQRPKTFAMQSADLKMWQRSQAARISPSCDCFQYSHYEERSTGGAPDIHGEVQDTQSEAWLMLESLVERAVRDRSQEFSPGMEMSPENWARITILPAAIGKLTSLKKLYLYGSHLVRIPSEIGNLTGLEELDLYTSYRLHWLPYEVTRCKRLVRTRFSTRALYGNYKYRWPFPRLPEPPDPNLMPASRECSVCHGPISESSVLQAWISLRVGTDVLPLLVNACSNECIRHLPPPADGYIEHPHRGGLNLVQPEPGFVRPHPAAGNK